MEKGVDIDTALIPEYVRMDLLAAIYNATMAYFQQPGVEERFQRWKEEKAKKEREKL